MQGTLSEVGGIRLRDVLPDGRFFGDNELRIKSCCSDSRACQPGDLFVAMVGTENDGHHFADRAVQRGAVAVLAERMLPVAAPTCIVDDSRVAYGRLCQALAENPSRHMNVIGISGTLGKTTTGVLTAAVLEAAGKRVGIMGSLGICDAISRAPARPETPVAPEFANWLARMRANGCSHAVLEASSRSLAERRTAGVELDAAVITNVRRGDLRFNESGQNYRWANARLFSHLKPGGVAIVNVDDPASKFLLSEPNGGVITIGVDNPAELSATVIERHTSEQTFLLTAGSETIPVRTHPIGNHHVYNCLSAAAVGLLAGMDLPTVVRGLESIDCVPGRMERIERGQDFAVFVDTGRTPDALAVALQSLRQVARGRLITVFGAPGDSNRDDRPRLGRVVERYSDLTIVTSDNPGWEKPLQIAHDVLDGCHKPGAVHVLPNRAKAIQWAIQEAQAGDMVLIAGKGRDNGQLIEGCHHPFNDCDVARYCLHELAAQWKDPPLRAVLRRQANQ